MSRAISEMDNADLDGRPVKVSTVTKVLIHFHCNNLGIEFIRKIDSTDQ